MFPISESVDTEFRKDLVYCAHEFVYLFESVTGGNCNAQAFFATSDGGVVDRLDVDVMFSEEFIGCSFCQCSVANEDRNNMRRARSRKRT